MNAILIRHLPTAMNRAGLLQGHRDEPIEEPDDATRAIIAANLEQMPPLERFDAILASRLRRTAMTAAHYGVGDRLSVEPLLDELDFGPFEGRSRAELVAHIGAAWEDDPASVVLGEPLTGLAERVGRFFERYRGQRVLAFGHGSWMRAAVALGRDGSIDGMNRFKIANNVPIELQLS